MALLQQQSNLIESVGKVVEIVQKNKAIIQFQLNNVTERALLRSDKLKVNGQSLPVGAPIDECLQINTILQFLCHPFDESGVDRCAWYITCAWPQDARNVSLKNNDTVLSGLYNCTGHISDIARRQGILTYINNGQEENVLFLASKLFISGKRMSAKANLMQQPRLEEGRSLGFDAVPCDPTDNDGHCNWFATVAWKGRKPIMEYDDVRNVRNKTSAALPQLSEIKLLTSNPHSLFLRSEGQVMKIINPEYGIALGAIKNNRWETVMFHRSHTSLFGRNLASDDLTNIFKEGDRIRLVAAAAPKKMIVHWVASQVRIYVHPSISQRLQF